MNRQRVTALVVLCFVLLLPLALGAGVVGGVMLDRVILAPAAPLPGVPAGASAEFNLMAEAWKTIQRVYVDRSALEPRKLAYGAINGMVEALGDTGHSTFLTPEMIADEKRMTEGHFDGIGIEVQTKGRYVVVVAPLDDSPALKAGVRPGDIILKVDGKDIGGLPLPEVVKLIVGPAGTSVTVTFMNPTSGNTRDITLNRARITVHNVTWQMIPGTTVAHVRIAAFSTGVTKDLRQALADSKDQGATALILDLRSDPGGVLDEAISVASQFLADGNVLQTKDMDGQVKAVPVEAGGVATEVPMVVLIDGGTASASEIVAAALQDAHRAQLVGETTFGTGTVLSQASLSDGSALLLATQEWLTPAGRVIWHQGIAPDVTVAFPQEGTPLLPRTEEGMTPEQVKASSDAQVLRALELVQQASGGGR